MMWLFFSLCSAISWGGAAVLMKKSYESVRPTLLLLINALIGLLLLLIIALFEHARVVLMLIPVALFVVSSYMFYYYALDRGKASLVSVVNSTYPLFVLILAAVFLGESITTVEKFGAAVIIVGIIALSVENLHDFFLKNFSWFWWGGLSAIMVGLGDFFLKPLIARYALSSWILAMALSWGISALLIYVFRHKAISFSSKNKKSIAYAAAGSTVALIGDILFYFALVGGKISIVSPITASYAAFATIFALFWLKEKIAPHQIAAIIITILGIVMVSM